MSYYFFKTVTDGGRIRLRALSKQLLSGSPVNTTINVNADKEIRVKYPIGTIYGSDRLLLNRSFYQAGTIYPLVKDSELVDEDHRPPAAMRADYAKFMGMPTDGIELDEEVDDDTKTVRSGSTLEKLRKNYPVPGIDKCGFHINKSVYHLLIRNINNNINTMLIGPTGCGKTTIVSLICEQLGLDLHIYDMGSMYDPVAGLLGVHRLQEGASVFDYAKFTEDIQKPGVVLLDELSRAPVTTNNILFPCLDERRNLPVEIAGGHDLRAVNVHPDCTFIATANIGSEYTGTMSMDKALVNRFFPVELGYLPQDIETKVLIKRAGVGINEAKNICAVAKSIRNLYDKQDIQTSVSTRETLMAAEMVADGWTPLEALEYTMLPLFEGTNLEGERGVVKKLFVGL